MKGGVKLKLIIRGVILVLGIVAYVYYSHPMPYKDIVDGYAKEFNLDKNLIYAIIKVESNFDSNAISPRGAKGLMQIMDNTGKWGAGLLEMEGYSHDKLFEPVTNLQIGSWYIAKLIRQYEGQVNMALAAYNAGSGNVAKWRGDMKYSLDGKSLHAIPFKETSQYVKKVNWHYNLYKILYRN